MLDNSLVKQILNLKELKNQNIGEDMKRQENIPVFMVTNWDMVGYTATTMVSVLCNTQRNIDFYIMGLRNCQTLIKNSLFNY